MIGEEHEKWVENKSACNVKFIIETIYETQNKTNYPAFKNILPDTIPIILYTSMTIEPYFAYGTTSLLQESFKTCFFRIEKINGLCVHLSLLLPVDEEGDYIDGRCVPYRFEKTNSKVILSTKDVCAIQCINPKLVNRQIIIIEQK